MKHLDLSYIKENVTNDEGFIRDLLGVFMESLDSDLGTFNEAVTAQDHGAVKRGAHKLKSSFRSLGMSKLATLTQVIENMAGDKDPMDQIQSRHAELQMLIPEVREDVRHYLNGH